MTRRLAPIAALSIALHATTSHAEAPTSARLSWVRGEGAARCPDAAFIAARVVAHLRGVDPFTAPASISVEAFVAHDDEGWHARIFDRDATGALLGARSLDSDEPDCDGVAQASALSIALTLNHGTLALAAPPRGHARREPPEHARRASRDAVAAPARDRHSPPLESRLQCASRSRRGSRRGSRRSSRSTPSARGRLRWMAEALATTRRLARRGAGLRVSLLRRTPRRLRRGVASRALLLEACAALTAGGVALAVTDAAVHDAPTGLWVGASLDAVARVTPLRPLLLEAGLSASTPFVGRATKTSPTDHRPARSSTRARNRRDGVARRGRAGIR